MSRAQKIPVNIPVRREAGLNMGRAKNPCQHSIQIGSCLKKRMSRAQKIPVNIPVRGETGLNMGRAKNPCQHPTKMVSCIKKSVELKSLR